MVNIIRNDMGRAVLNYAANGNDLCNSLLHLRATMGLGKTHVTTDKLSKNGFDYIYLTFLHRVSEQVARQVDLVHIDKTEESCERPDLLRLYGNVSNFSLVCNKLCPSNTDCEKKKNLRKIFTEPQSWTGVHHHLGNLVPMHRKEHETICDIVIIDENIIPSIYREFRISRPLIINTRSLLSEVDYSPSVNLFNNFLNFAENWIRKGSIDNHVQLYNLITDYYLDYNGFAELENVVEQANNVIINYYDTSNGEIIQRNYIDSIRKMINIIPQKSSRFFRTMFDFEGGLVCRRYFTEHLDLPNTGIIYLDGTTSDNVVNRIFPDRNIIRFERSVQIRSPVMQLSGGRYPMATIERNPSELNPTLTATGKGLLDIAYLAVENEKNDGRMILICSRKRYHNLIREKLSHLDNWALTNYGGVLGSREWEDYHSVLLFGAPFVSPNIIHRDMIFLELEEREITKLYTEDDMIQFVHRIRPVLKPGLGEDCRIYLLTNIDLGLGEYTTLYTRRQMYKFLKGIIIRNISNETENRIKSEILTVLRVEGPKKKTDLLSSIIGNQNIKNHILKKMIKHREIIFTRRSLTSRKKRGRPAEFLGIPPDL